MIGGFSGIETAETERDWVANQTILSGDIGTTSVTTDNSDTVVLVAGNNVRIDGLIIEGGDTTGNGAGVSALNVQGLKLENCVLRNNKAGTTSSGGGAYIYHPTGFNSIINCVFESNDGGYDGGGVYLNSSGAPSEVINTVFFANKASRSGAGMTSLASGNIINCTFVSNEDTDANHGS